MGFAPVKRLKVAEQIAGAIRDAILGGTYSPGQSLPSERALATQFDVNRSTIREALTRLEAKGLVDIKHGGGITVRDFLVSAGLQMLPFLVAPGGQLDPDLTFDLLEIRVGLLEWTGRQAAVRATPESLAVLRMRFDELEAADTTEAIQVADYGFYEAMVAMSGNRVLAMISHVVRAAYFENRELFAALYHPSVFDVSRHRAALHAIEQGDADTAATTMADIGRAALGGS
jgi:DNA-binding FadR family transcriptional regulator